VKISIGRHSARRCLLPVNLYGLGEATIEAWETDSSR
jgi:hypothetical protein